MSRINIYKYEIKITGVCQADNKEKAKEMLFDIFDSTGLEFDEANIKVELEDTYSDELTLPDTLELIGMKESDFI